MKHSSTAPYYYHVQTDFEQFWSNFDVENRSILFVFGLGFDPRCVPAFLLASRVLSNSKLLHTICLRFKNPMDENLTENTDGTNHNLKEIEEISRQLNGDNCHHDHLEVNLFDGKGRYEGDIKLVADFTAHFSSLNEYSDVIIDISAFPRSMMYALLTRVYDQLKPGQNLFAVLSEVLIPVDIQEQGYSNPHFLIAPRSREKPKGHAHPMIWIPILGGSTERLHQIYSYLKPREVFPIVPFPTQDPRLGDRIMLRSRTLFDEWHVPFSNVMYACGDVPFDIYRKIHDIVERYRSFMSTEDMVVSALSGRSLSLGVLLAAWRHNLPVCLIQPKTYKLISPTREELRRASTEATVTLYWLSGEIYQ